MKRVTALDLCRYLERVLHNNITSDVVLASKPIPGHDITTKELLTRLNNGVGVIFLDEAGSIQQFQRADRVCVDLGDGYVKRSGTVVSDRPSGSCYAVVIDGYVSISRFHHRFISKLTDQDVGMVCSGCRKMIFRPGVHRAQICRCSTPEPVSPLTNPEFLIRAALDKRKS